MQRAANPLFLKAFSMRCLRIVCFGVAIVTLASCALFGGGPKLAVPEVGFVVKGRMAVRDGDDGFSSSFLWQHREGRDEIDLWGPMGQGHSRLVGTGSAVTVYTAKGEVFRERDSDAAMRRWLGFTLPMTALTYWVRGERAPGYPIDGATRAESGELTMLEQLSWHLEFSAYKEFDEGRRLPTRIVATRGQVKVTLLPAEWSFGRDNAFDTL
jgi:outer membrane lipoprotein LolB